MSHRSDALVRRPEPLPVQYDRTPAHHLFEEVVRYDPQPTTPPVAEPNLPRLPPLSRLSAVIVYTFHRWEHRLSPGGGIQAWWRIFIRIGLVLTAPALLLPLLVWMALKLVAFTAAVVLLLINVLKGIAVACCIFVALLVFRNIVRQFRR